MKRRWRRAGHGVIDYMEANPKEKVYLGYSEFSAERQDNIGTQSLSYIRFDLLINVISGSVVLLKPGHTQSPCHEHNTKLNDERGEDSDDEGGSDDEPRRDNGRQGVVMATRVGVMVRKVV